MHILIYMIPVHDCKKELRDADLKVTPARLGVLEVLEKTDLPVDVSAVIAYLEKHYVRADVVTVFRILKTLTEKGIVRPIQFNEGKLRYEYAGKPEHHHFVCDNCGTVEDVDDCNVDVLIKQISKKKGMLVKRHSLEFFGLCVRCKQKN